MTDRLTETEQLGPVITLEWAHGPVLTVRRVDFPDGINLVQIESYAAKPPEAHDGVEWVAVRLDRENLQAMIDLLDGKPVKDWRG